MSSSLTSPTMKYPTHYENRLVNYSKTYPRVYWPQHPAAQSSGLVAVHRAVAYEIWGNDIFGKEIHHVNEEVNDWSPENLELCSLQEHRAKHTTHPKTRVCSFCNSDVVIRTSKRHAKTDVFCNHECFYRFNEKVSWPEHRELLKMVDESNFSVVGRILGVSDNAVRKRLKNHK